MATLVRRTYKAKLPDGTTETRACQHWSIQYRDVGGKIRRVKGYRDKAATRQLAARLELANARGETGLLNPHKASLARPIVDHVDEWVAALAAAGRSGDYGEESGQRLKRVAEEAGWATLRDVTAAGFVAWRQKARTAPRLGTRKGRTTVAARTLNEYLAVWRTFLNWCATTGRVPGVPGPGGKSVSVALAGVDKVDGPTVCNRRALTDAEVVRLLAVAPAARKLPYRVAMAIGLRRTELSQLLWGDLKLAAAVPFVVLRAETTKAGRADRLSLPASLAADLRAYRDAADDAGDGDRVFRRVPSLVWWKNDLAAAGIPYLDGLGRQADFHGGTRKTLCTRMHRAGVPLAVAMRSMRHTDARLTLVDYADDEQLGAEAETAVLQELGVPVYAAKNVKAPQAVMRREG